MATNPSKTPEGQEEKPNKPSRFIIAMVPVKKSPCPHHPRSDGEKSILVSGPTSAGVQLLSTFFQPLPLHYVR